MVAGILTWMDKNALNKIRTWWKDYFALVFYLLPPLLFFDPATHRLCCWSTANVDSPSHSSQRCLRSSPSIHRHCLLTEGSQSPFSVIIDPFSLFDVLISFKVVLPLLIYNHNVTHFIAVFIFQFFFESEFLFFNCFNT